MLKSVILRFKLSSEVTQEELSLIREEIISFFEQTFLKPEEVICRKGSIEIIIIFGTGALYIADKIFGGALEEIGKIFVSWIKEKFSRSSQSNMPLDDQNAEIFLENGVKEVTTPDKEGLAIAYGYTQRSETILRSDFPLLNSILKFDGEAELATESESEGRYGLSIVFTENKFSIMKVDGKIVEMKKSESRIEKIEKADGKIIENQTFVSRSYKRYE